PPFPFRPIVIGGDDLCFVSRGDLSIHIAKKFAEKLNQKSKNYEGLFQNGLSCSIGIVIVKHHFPFFNAYSLAEDLLSNAKKKSRSFKEENSSIDFAVIITSSLEPIMVSRERQFYYKFGSETYYLTGRPYIIAHSNFKEETLDKFIEKTKKLKEILPSNKFNALRKIIRNGEEYSKFQLSKMLRRLSEEKRKEFNSIMEDNWEYLWRKGKFNGEDVKINNFIDMVEIASFI
ncbi:MAG: hypothetical protein NC833_02340, partial [Candidatus Omnitrophica bacterium]|nr:hypothetical protein [Candidatus Omnitrophota bacterium]